MNTTVQYTIRNVPLAIDAKLKAQAKQRGISLNKLVLGKLGALPQRGHKPKIYHDLDWFFDVTAEQAQEAERVWQTIHEARQLDKKRAQAELEAEQLAERQNQ